MSILSEISGRSVDVNVTGGDLIKGLVAEVQMISAHLAQGGEQIEQLTKAVEKLDSIDKHIVDEAKKVNDNLEELLDAVKKCCGIGGGSKQGNNPSQNKKTMGLGFADGIGKSHKVLTQAFTKAFSSNQFATAISKAVGGGSTGGGGNRRAGIGGGGGGGRSGGGGVNPGAGISIQQIDRMAAAMGAVATGATKINGMMKQFLGSIGIDLSNVFKGVISDEMIFISNMRKLGSETGQYADELFKIGQVTKETGVDRVTYQKAYEKEMRKGMVLEMKSGRIEQRNIKAQQQGLKNSLNTSYLLGMDAEQTAEMFGSWNRELGLTTTSISLVQDHMRHVSRISGVSGDNMLRAAQNAEKFMKSMQKAGNLTGEASANLIKTQTFFEKYGVGESGGKLLDALSSNQGFLQADPGMKSLMLQSAQRSGQMTELQGGMIPKSEEGMKKFMDSMGKTLQERVGNLIGDKNIDLTKLTKVLNDLENSGPGGKEKAMRMRRTMEMSGAFGQMGAGGIEQMAKAQADANKTIAERLADIDKKKVGVTDATQLAFYDKQKAELVNDDNKKQNNRFLENLQSGGDLNKAIATTSQQSGRAFDPATATKAILDDLKSKAGDKFDSILKAQGFDSQESAMKQLTTGSGEGILEANERLRAAMNEVEKGYQASQNPMEAMNQTIKELNDQIKDGLQPFLAANTSAIITASIALGAVTSAMAMLIQGLQLFGAMRGLGGVGRGAASVGRGAMRMLGGGGRAAAAASGTVMPTAMRAGLPMARLAPAAGRAIPMATRLAPAAAAAGGSGLAGGALAALSKVAVPITIAVGAFQSLAQGVDASRAASEMFGTTLDKLTSEQKNAAFGAGTLTGVLNFLTFGIFDEWIGTTGTLTKALAGMGEWLLKAVPPINWIIGGFRSFSTVLIDGFRKAFAAAGPLMDKLGQLWAKMGEFWNWINGKFESVFGISLGGIIEKVGGFVGQLGVYLLALPIQWLFEGLTGLADIMLTGIDAVSSLWTSLTDLWDKSTGIGDFLMTAMKDGMSYAWKWFKGWIKGDTGAADIAGNTDAVLSAAKKSNEAMIEQAGGDPVKLAKTLLRMKDTNQTLVSGSQANLNTAQKSVDDIGGGLIDNWLTNNTANAVAARDAEAKALAAAQNQLASVEAQLSQLDPKVVAEAQKADTAMTELAEKGTTPGSIYTHDIYLQDLMTKLLNHLAPSSGSMSATNLGAFALGQGKEANGSMGLIGQIMNMILGPAEMPGSTNDSKANASGNTDNSSAYSSVVNKGLFDNDNIKETSSTFIDTFTKLIAGDLNGVYQNVRSAMGGGSNSSSKSLYNNVSTSKTMYPLEDPATIDGLLNTALTESSAPQKASASSTFFTPEDAETYIASQMISNKPSGAAALIPGLDSLLDWHTTVHEARLDKIIELLEKSNQPEQVVGMNFSEGDGGGPPDNGSVRHWSKDKVRGYWSGLQSGAYSPQQNATGDFRGGND